MPTKLINRIPEIQLAMHRAAELLLHRAADTHVMIYQQTAPRRTGLMADSTHKEPAEPTVSLASHIVVMVIAPQPYSGDVEFGTHSQVAQPAYLPAYEIAKTELIRDASTLIPLLLAGKGIPMHALNATTTIVTKSK